MIATYRHSTWILVRSDILNPVTQLTLLSGYVHSKVLKKLNPLKLTICIPAPKHRGEFAPSDTSIQSQAVYDRVLKYIGKLIEVEWKSKEHPILARFSRATDLVAAFKSQFRCYSLLRYPFDKPLAEGQTVRAWWCSFLEHPEANVLAVSYRFMLLSLLCGVS